MVEIDLYAIDYLSVGKMNFSNESKICRECHAQEIWYHKLNLCKKCYDGPRYNEKGFDKYGFDRTGRDRQGFDKDGYNVNGYDRQGVDKHNKTERENLYESVKNGLNSNDFEK